MLIVDTTSWHYRIYAHWRKNIARKPPNAIDLCHYMRAIILFTPGYYVGLALLYAGIGLACAIAALFLLVTVPLWGPIWLVTHNRDWHKRGARRVSDAIERNIKRAAGATDQWLRTGGQWVLIGLFVVLLVIAFTLMTLQTWWLGLAWFGGVIGGSVLAVAIIALLAWLIDDVYLPRRRAKLAARSTVVKIVRPKKQKGPSILRLAWTYIKAKKQRICPLIQTSNPGA